MLIALEGLDASGKTTQLKAAAAALGANTLKFPAYDTKIGGLIRRMLAKERVTFAEYINFGCGYNLDVLSAEDMAYMLQALMVVNRYELITHIENQALPGCPSTADFVMDRYHMSAMAHGLVDGLPREWLDRIHAPLPKPDVYILLDMPVEESFRRRPNRQDAYESNEARLRQVAMMYRELWWDGQAAHDGTTYEVIDAMQSPEQITAEIVEVVTARRRLINIL